MKSNVYFLYYVGFFFMMNKVNVEILNFKYKTVFFCK